MRWPRGRRSVLSMTRWAASIWCSSRQASTAAGSSAPPKPRWFTARDNSSAGSMPACWAVCRWVATAPHASVLVKSAALFAPMTSTAIARVLAVQAASAVSR